jgi:mannose-6-phosphate isomerase-like protein (cupin superfamily)
MLEPFTRSVVWSSRPPEPFADSAARIQHDRRVPIENFSLVNDDGWTEMQLEVMDTYLWAEGGKLADAPVDFAKTFGGNFWVSTRMDPAFNINGLRCAPDFAVPRHHHNLDELIVVLAGEFHVSWGGHGRDGSRTVGPGAFWISKAGTSYLMTAGPEGVSYTETWPEPMANLLTWWHDEGWVAR